MVFFIDEARSRARLLTNVNKKMVFFIEGFPKAGLPASSNSTIGEFKCC